MNANYERFAVVSILILAALACAILPASDTPSKDSASYAEETTPIAEKIEPNSSHEGTLKPGELLRGLDGVSLGAIEGTIKQPVSITIERVPIATIEASLPEIAAYTGDIYRISPETPILPDTEHPLIIAIPIPDGISNTNLVVAVLLSTDEIDDQEEEEFFTATGERVVQDVWELVEGQVDQENKVFLAVLPYLPKNGRVVSLVSSEAYESPPISGRSGGLALLAQPALEVQFEAKCRPAVIFIPFTECTQEIRELLEDMAFQSYDLYVNQLGFRAPRLERLGNINFDPPAYQASLTFIIEIREVVQIDDGLEPIGCQYNFEEDGKPDGPLGGMYTRAISRFVICLGGPQGASFSQSLVNHEFFHAIQNAYPKFLENRESADGERSFVEGTATVAMDSTDSMVVRRSTRGVRDVDVGLFRGDRLEFEDSHAYNTQDFFLYLANRFGHSTIKFLQPMLEEGGNREAVDAVFRNDPEYLGDGLPEIYWDWVKNQAFEKKHDIQTTLGDTCQLSTNNNGTYYVFSSGNGPPVIEYAPDAIPNPVPFDLPPLTSAIYQIDFKSLPAESYDAMVSVNSPFPAIKSKFYEEVDPANPSPRDCMNDPDRKELEVTVLPGQSDPQTIYLLIANTSLREVSVGTIEFTKAEIIEAASCLVGDWQVDNATYLGFLRQTAQDVEEGGEFSSVDGIFGMILDDSGLVTNYTEDFSITMCSGENCLKLPVEHEGTAQYSTEGDLLTITGGQSVFAQIGGVTGSAQSEGGSAPYQCTSETLAILMEGLPPLIFDRQD